MTWDLLADGPKAAAEFGLTWLCQSSALLALGLLAGRMLRRSGPAVQSAVYRTALGAVLVCPVASILLARAGFDGVVLRLPVRSEAIGAAPTPALVPASRVEPTDLAARERLPEDLEGRLEPTKPSPEAIRPAVEPPAVSPPPVTLATPAAARGTEAGWLASGVAVALAVWGLGAALMGLRLAVGVRRMGRLRASASRAEPVAEALCRELARRMDLSEPAVLRTPFLHSPCVDGLRKAAILLPDDEGLDLRDAFVHELAHLARRDVLWNLLRQSATALLWFQPLLWVLSRRMEVAAEEVCDDYVVQFGADRASYAGLLLELAGRTLPPASSMAVGMVSLRSLLGRRVVRILDTSRVLSTRVGRRGVAATLAAGLGGTLLAGMLGVASGERKAEAQAPPKVDEAKKEPRDQTIRGQVVGPDGKPIPGATVRASRSHLVLDGIGDDHSRGRRSEFVSGVADADGRFRLAFETPGPESEVDVIATAPGFGMGYRMGGDTIRLRPGDLPITGRLVDLEGRPVAGAKVELDQIWIPSPDAPPGAISESRPWSLEKRLGVGALALLPGGTKTDADGRFRIEGLGLDTLTELTISGPMVALRKVKVLTRPMDRASTEQREADFVGVDEPAVHGANCTIAVEPTRPIEGTVRDIETGEPIPGAVVTAASLSGSELMIDGLISTETDARGHYRLLGLPKEGAKGHKLAVYPPLDRPYFITRRIEVAASPGIAPAKLDIALKRGLWITGKVTDVTTGRPVPAAIDYFPLLSNANAKDYPNFDPNVTASMGIKTRYKTDRDGRFRIAGLPGGGVVTAHTDDRSYLGGVGAETIAGRAAHAGSQEEQLLTYDRIFPALYQGLKGVEIPEGTASATCDLGLDPGGSVRVRLIDTSGKPVTHAVVYGQFPEGSDQGDHGLYGASVARIGGLVPGRPRLILIRHRDRKIGAVLTLGQDGPRDGREMTVMLRPTATLTGRLLDAAGKPASGIIQVDLLRTAGSFIQGMPTANAKLDADGRFRCEVVPAGGPYKVTASNGSVYGFRRKMEPDAFKSFDLAKDLTVEPGQAVDFGTVDVTTTKKVADQTPPAKAEAADVPITGRVVDLEGRPVAGVSVKVENFRAPKTGDLTPWLDGARQGGPPQVAGRHIAWDRKAPETATREARTDRDGRFRVEGLGAERVVMLTLQGDAIAQASIDVATRPMAPIVAPGFSNSYGPGAVTIYGADFTYTAAPCRPVEGVVKDAKTGAPLADAEVRSYRFAGSDWVGIMTLRTRTDEKGHFRLAGLPKGKGNTLLIVPNDEQPYLLQEVDLPDPPGAGAIPVEVALHRGIWIEGKLTEKETGQPVPGARLTYFPFLENTFAQAHPAFDSDGNTDAAGFQDRYLTKADGTFRLVGLPGRAIVGASANNKPYLEGTGSEAIEGLNKRGVFLTYRNPVDPGKFWPTVMKEIKPPGDAEVVRVDLQVLTGPSVRLRVVDASGHPVAGASTLGLMGRGSYEHQNIAVEGEVMNLMPDEERTVLIRHEGHKIGKVVRVRKGDDANGPVVVKLEPLAAMVGRVADADGHPVQGATVRPDLLPGGDFSPSLPEVTTDEKGRFKVPDVPTGCDYSLNVDSSMGAVKDRRFAGLKKATVKPGETTDVGEIRFKNAGQAVAPGTVDVTTTRKVAGQATAAKAEAADVPITGRVVDLEGRPVAGVSVKVERFYTPPSGDLEPWLAAVRKGEPPWTAYRHISGSSEIPKGAGREATTGEDGRFRLEGFGGERVVGLRLTGDTVAATDLEVITRLTEPIDATGFPSTYGPGHQMIYGADFTLGARPGRPIEGVVLDARTRQPMAGVEIQSSRFAGSDFVQVSTLKATSDERGRFRLVGLPKGKGNQLMAVPNDDQPYFQREIKIDDPPGIGPVTLEVELHRGIWITGKVTDKATGEPARNARLHYLPFLDNKFVQALPEFDKGGNVDGSQMRYQTRDDGSYKLVGMPGRAVVGVDNDGKKSYRAGAGFEAFKKEDLNEHGYIKAWPNPIWAGKSWPLAMKEINPPEGADQVSLDLELDPGLTVRLKVVDAEGQPVSGVTINGSGGGPRSQSIPDGDVRIDNFSPGSQKTLIVRHEGRKLARVVRVGPGDDAGGPVVVALAPLARIKGRTVDADDHPLPKAKIRPDLMPGGDFNINLGQVVSDADGRFEVVDVPTGCDYTMFAEAGTMIKDYRQAWVEAKVKPGEMTDVGDIRFKKE